MKERISVRNFSEGDAEKILDYREETACISFPGLSIDREKSRKCQLSHMKRHPGTIKVAESGGRQIGFIEFQPKSSPFGRYGCINIIFVDERHRGRGIGELLLREAEEWFCERGVSRINATITNMNRNSLDFFRKEGYIPRRMLVEKRL
jgi:GNAT superfamily N-acetyltransferase